MTNLSEESSNSIANCDDIKAIKAKIKLHQDKLITNRNLKLKTLKNLEINEIIKHFTFDIMKTEHQEFCSMLAKNKPCHDLSPDTLNCFGCMCPNYKLESSFNREKQLYQIGLCNEKSVTGFYKLTNIKTSPEKKYLIWNCSNCKIPHNLDFIKILIENELKKLKY